ncbi:MAG: hypothetical protein KDK04_09750, partial [Candidatus Competibacteraceae bacterium]|nr:hypothetical protein [Candidatus Competibacteraceae bacterium]
MDASQDSAAFKALLKEFDIEPEHLLYHERQAINRWMDAALIKLGKDTTAEEDAKKTKARMPNSGVDPDRIQLQIGRGQIHQHLKDAINYVTNPEAAAAKFKQDLTEALQEHYGSSVGDTLFAQRGDSASAQGRDLNKGLTFDDREWLTKAARELPEKTNLGSTQRRLQQLNNVLPARLNLTVNANNLHPTAELNGTINAQASGTKAYLDDRVNAAKPDPANPGLSDQLLKDVQRMDIRVDNNGNAIRLDKTNSADTLGQFAGND